MASIMTTFVKINNLNPETHKKLVDLFSNPENSELDEVSQLYGSTIVNIPEHLSKLFGENFKNEEEISRDWITENVGSKSLEIEVSNGIGEEFEEEVELIVSTAYNVPTEYLQKLVEILNQIDKNAVVYGTYEDENYSPVGAFIYGYDYDDIEDYDGDVDFEQMLDDDDYRDEIYEGIAQLRDNLYEGYLQVKKEREDE
jgi:hypothetical protein